MIGSTMHRAVALFAGFALLAALPATAQNADPFRSAPAPAPQAVPRPAPRPAPTPEPPPPPLAAFDGHFVGSAPPSPPCAVTSIEIVVANGHVVGSGEDSAKHTWAMMGEVSPDGSFTGMSGTQPLAGRFDAGGRFTGRYRSSTASCGDRSVTLQRVPTGLPPGPFDGRYTGGMPAVASCAAVAIDARVTAGRLVGNASEGGKNAWLVVGSVAPDGSVSGYNGTQPLTGRFAGGAFSGTYTSTTAQCGQRTITLRQAGPS